MWDVEGLKRQLSSRELAGWMAYASIEPFGEERADLRAGIIASVIANVNRDPKKRKEALTAQDFMPFIERPSEAYRRGMELKSAFMRVTSKKKTG